MEALRNPMPLGSSSEGSLGDEACSSQTKGSGAEASPTQKERGSPSQDSSPGATGRTLPRRSRSWDRSLRSSQSDDHRASHHSAGSSGPSCATAESPSCNKEEADVNTNGSSFRGQDVLAELLCLEAKGWLPSTGDPPDQVPRQVLEVNQELLQSGVVSLPGTRDRQGRAAVQVCTRGPLWCSKHASSAELTHLLKYLHGIPRKEVRDLGLVILVDTRRSPAPLLSPSVLLLVEKESAFRPDKDATVQCELVGSLKALHKLVDSAQLAIDLGGSFPYNHSDWICFHRVRLEPFTTNCEEAIVFLQSSVCSLNTRRTPSTAQEVMESISKHKATMKRVLEDALLVALRLEGGTVLARLRREEPGASEDCRDTIEAASRLYHQVDEEVHRLVLASNQCLQELESLREWRMLQEGAEQQRCQKGLQLTEENNPQDTEDTVQDFKRRLSAAAGRAKRREGELAGWASLERLEPLGPELAAERLKSCPQEAVGVAVESVPRASTAMPGVGGQQVLGPWLPLGLWCQQIQLYSQEALPEATLGHDAPTLGWSPLKCELAQGAERRHHELPWIPLADFKGQAGEQAPLLPSFPGQAALCGQEDKHLSPGVPAPDCRSTCPCEPIQTPAAHPRKHPLKKVTKKTQSFEILQPDSGPKDSRRPGHTGVIIKGLEVTSTMALDKPPPRPPGGSPLFTWNQSLFSPSRIQSSEEDRSWQAGSRLQHIMAEMISTEREYVRSLAYVIDNYFPEMERVDLPQDLPGKRGVIFGNLEKLRDFHCQHFLRELECCRHCPWAMGRSFLRHEEQFGMYALYSKNKPRSDALLCSHGNSFFKDKQWALGDRMDLASYLLKPVQRLGKYALLLQDLAREASRCPTHEQELGELRTAVDMVRFQLRHGNDLLAVDAVRGCDVDLKEQGQLQCQDELIVCCGRKKCLRHVFLFDELILFSKTKKVDRGHDIYTYKQSFKTTEIRMTENVRDSGLRFEIWFRRRHKSQDTYVLQASSAEVKAAWTAAIRKILWRQALQNRELRMQEMSSMGMGNKPFVDIKPSDAAISDRAIDYIMQGPGSQTRVSVAVPSRDCVTPFKRPHSTILDSSSSSSSSQTYSALGPLTLQASTSPACCPWPPDISTCIEEDELEMGSQPSTREWRLCWSSTRPSPQWHIWVGEPVHMFVSLDFIYFQKFSNKLELFLKNAKLPFAPKMK
uniref:Pleckstrin homology and RhoGEF domain containing G4B n=1 Tax=Equus asinus TaxID=9793 RepID=A0A8C4MFI9_EQUAS